MLLPVAGSLTLLLSWLALPPGSANATFEAALLLVLVLVWILRSRKSVPALIVSIFVGHSIYSILIFFYLTPMGLAFPLTAALNEETLSVGLRLLWFIPIALWNIRDYETTPKLRTRPTPIAFWPIVAVVLYLAISQIDRTGSSDVYRVRISPLYEYSYILILFAYLLKGRGRGYTFVLVGLCTFIVVQDAVYGGRATSVQVLIVLALTVFRHLLTPLRVATMAFIGVIVGSLIGVMRGAGTASGNILGAVDSVVTENLMTSSTSIYAYYASLTHIAAEPQVETGQKLNSFCLFVSQTVFGGGESLTTYVSENYFVNVGGGLFPSNFYFWGGPAAVAIASISIALLLRTLGRSSSTVAPAVLIVFIASMPRWLLYSPSAAIRPLLIFFMLWLLLRIFQIQPFQATQGESRSLIKEPLQT